MGERKEEKGRKKCETGGEKSEDRKRCKMKERKKEGRGEEHVGLLNFGSSEK